MIGSKNLSIPRAAAEVFILVELLNLIVHKGLHSFLYRRSGWMEYLGFGCSQRSVMRLSPRCCCFGCDMAVKKLGRRRGVSAAEEIGKMARGRMVSRMFV